MNRKQKLVVAGMFDTILDLATDCTNGDIPIDESIKNIRLLLIDVEEAIRDCSISSTKKSSGISVTTGPALTGFSDCSVISTPAVITNRPISITWVDNTFVKDEEEYKKAKKALDSVKRDDHWSQYQWCDDGGK
jgi:hypothetical protein